MGPIFETLNISDPDIRTWLMFVVSWLLLVALVIIVHKIVMRYQRRFAVYTKQKWDEDLIDHLYKPTRWLAVTFATAAAVQLANVPLKQYVWVGVTLKSFTIFCIFWCIERSVYSFLKSGILLRNISSNAKILVSLVIRSAIYAIGIMMILDSAGISITPILASLGVGSIAVALALQDTLSNLFSGFYILADKPFQVGDFIGLDGGVQGHVTHVGWRSTHLRLSSNNFVVIPNAKVASSIVTNYDMNQEMPTLTVSCGVAYGSDLEKVERICIEVARELLIHSPLGVKAYQPLVRFQQFGESSMDFIVILQVNKYTDQGELKHYFIKALYKRFATEGIDIPFPHRVVTLKREANDLKI